jgi:hypothetical protein
MASSSDARLAPDALPWYNARGMRRDRRLGGLVALSLLAYLALDGARSPARAQAADPSAIQPEAADPPAEAAGTQPAPEGQPAPETRPPLPPAGPIRRLIVIDAATYGVDPVVGRVATDRLRRTAAELGYEVLDAAATVAAAQRLRMPYPPAPADLWRVTWIAQAQRGVFARVWASEGRYVIELVVASLDGTGPFFARETAGAADLRESLDRALRATLPPPTQWQEQPPAVAAGPAAAPALRRWRERPRDELAHPGGIGVRLPEPPFRRLSLSVQTEAVIGTTQGGFYNHMVGARLDVRITRDLLIGAYVGYANLQGRNDRANNLLVMLQGEQRIRVSPTVPLTIPLRVAVGYLPFNGPVVRLAAGINYALSDEWEIGADLITPTFWVLPDDFAVSLDIAVEVTYRFP